MAAAPPAIKVVHDQQGHDERDHEIPLAGKDQRSQDQEDHDVYPKDKPRAVSHTLPRLTL